MKKDVLIFLTPFNSFDKFVMEEMNKNDSCFATEDLFYDGTNILTFVYNFFKYLLIIKKENYKTVIVFDNFKIGELLHLFFPEKVCVFFWNTIPEVLYGKVSKTKMPIYTFDKDDVERFSINYTDQFYFLSDNIEQEEKIDVLFVGENKGRLNTLIEFYEKCKNQNLRVEMKVYDEEIECNDEKINELIIKEYIDYYKYREMIYHSKALLEIAKEGQEALTLRTMEAIFLNKKIITNNRNIINRDFYRKNRIFVLGKDDINDLGDFIKNPMEKYTEAEKYNYSFDKWIENFK